MQAIMVHFCDETMFFSWVLFIQMHMVINMSLDLLIGLGSKLTNLLCRKLCDYLLIKSSFVSNNGLLK